MKNLSDKQEKNGRPTRLKQLKIQNDIKKYFNRGFSIEDVYNRTGYNRKTISKYYSIWTIEIEKDQLRDLKEREKDARRRTLLCYNDLLCNEYENRDYIVEQIKDEKNKQAIVQLLSKRAESTRIIIDLRRKIDGVEVTPTIGEALKEIISETQKK